MKQLSIIFALLFYTLCCKAQLYGFNENSYPAYDNAAFVDSIAALHPDIIRYPQGKNTNYSDWKTDKPTLPALAAMRLKVGCEILFVLNMNTSTLAYQLQMLDSAAALGIPIKYIEFANEVDNADNPLLKKFHSSGIEYGTECKIWADVIKQKYPDAKFAAWGENKDSLPNWNSELLSVYTPDALTSHLYPVESVIAPNGIIDTAFFSHWIEHSFERSGIDFHIPVWITEYNLSPFGLNLLKRGQHKSGLIFMTQKLASMGCQMLIMHSLSQGTNGAFEVYDDDHVSKRPTGRAFEAIQRKNHRL